VRAHHAPIAIVGPTAAGKSAIAEALALELDGEIVSADSMQVYRGMDIGTAKVPLQERRVPYHCVDLVRPGQTYSAALYQVDARQAIDGIVDRGGTPVLAGGTGLYVRAALDRFEFPAGQMGGEARTRYEDLADEIGTDALHALLRGRDPAAADAIHPHNVRRVVRALEMADAGISYGEQVAGFGARACFYPGTRFVGIDVDRPVLYERIERRVDDMVAAGLPDEVAALLEAGYRDVLTASQAIGYKEIVPVIEGSGTLDEAADAIKRATRRYAKRQLTWFRADPRIRWLDVTELSPEAAVDAVIDLLESAEHAR
jgi:tRNA dimethylallyltransferase